MRLGDAVYRLMLRLFPETFRRRHESDMVEQFAEQRRALSGHPLGASRLWARAASDVLRHGLALRASGAKARGPVAPVLTILRQISRQSIPRETELRHALRSLRRSPWYALTVVSVMALSIALSATVFAIVDGVPFKSSAGRRNRERWLRMRCARTTASRACPVSRLLACLGFAC